MEERDESILIESVAGAWRPDDPRQISAHPNWYDLDDDARVQAFDVATEMRRLEAAVDPEGLSATARRVMAKIVAAR